MDNNDVQWSELTNGLPESSMMVVNSAAHRYIGNV
ncbi:uncharacterized protein METZ01_LOCUS36837 [marine metagenome]|uniref:Uncharacterized protein n=1 Tax=marine metagenome TaxID=408172 RepID=A0A381R326_9ZZZZ